MVVIITTAADVALVAEHNFPCKCHCSALQYFGKHLGAAP